MSVEGRTLAPFVVDDAASAAGDAVVVVVVVVVVVEIVGERVRRVELAATSNGAVSGDTETVIVDAVDEDEFVDVSPMSSMTSSSSSSLRLESSRSSTARFVDCRVERESRVPLEIVVSLLSSSRSCRRRWLWRWRRLSW